MNDIESETKGMLIAVQAALRALSSSHPDPDALTKAFEFEREQTLAFLLEKQTPEAAVAAFRAYMDGVVDERA